MNEITIGSVVKYKVTTENKVHFNVGETGYFRVTAKFTKTANLGGIFNGRIYFKGVPLAELTECHEEWYADWSKSETYMSM